MVLTQGVKLCLVLAMALEPLAAATIDSEMAGYMGVDTEQAPAKYNAGFSIYVAAWPLLNPYPGHRYQTGLFGT